MVILNQQKLLTYLHEQGFLCSHSVFTTHVIHHGNSWTLFVGFYINEDFSGKTLRKRKSEASKQKERESEHF